MRVGSRPEPQDSDDVQATELNVYGSPRIPGLSIGYFSRPIYFLNVSSVSELQVYNSDVYFPALNGAGLITIEVDEDRGNEDPTSTFSSAFSNLSEVYSINATGFDFNRFSGFDLEIYENLTMNDVSMGNKGIFGDGGRPADGLIIPSIRGTLTILEASDVPVSFTNLTTIGDDLVFANSSGCSLSFRALTEVSAIRMQNNTDTTLPGNMDRLELANSIHLNGYIDT
ncbi:hypothetical protein SLS62_004838 [Diatrype stigma]|uniref:Uncharacterized protein n=1 Tax=Diatrype stigma TaxID=117547 RepID=A0AAN9YSN5_9PEZI